MNVAQLEVIAAPATRPLNLRSVVKRWRGADAPVLNAVDLDVEPGNSIVISGRNGSGKTTLLRIAAGIIAADSGEVSVAGLPHNAPRRQAQRRIGYVSAGNAALYARLTVANHLDMWARLALLPRRRRREALEHTSQRFALDELRNRRVDRISTGQRQRLRLALGFLHAPDLVLLDEPEGSLDDEAIVLLSDAIDDVRARGGGVVMCAPTGFNASLPHDRRLTLSQGRLVDE